jgi:hypothetical protein
VTNDPLARAEAARHRASQAAEAAARARKRLRKAPSAETVAEAEERRIHAEERLATVSEELGNALERSERAHLSAAELDDETGHPEAAERHRADARADRERRESLGRVEPPPTSRGSDSRS